MRVSIDHPTDRPNYSVVHIGEMSLAFSYRTLIGVRVPGSWNWTTIKNYWGPTTGKHLNDLNPNHENRLTAEEFARFVDGLGLEVSI